MVECWFRTKILEFEYQISDKDILLIESKKTETYLKDNYERFKCYFIKKWGSIHNTLCQNSICKEISNLIKNKLIFIYSN